jgi:molecular chaperone DnaK
MRLLGIDLGTTNTVGASAGRAVPVSFEDGRLTLPSVVSFLPNGASLTGTAAKRRRSIDSRNTIFSAKRIIGRRWSDAKTQQFHDRYPFDLVELAEDTPAFETRAGAFTATDIASMVLSSMFDELKDLGQTFDRTIITVPAGFNGRQRNATVAAARKAGLPEVRLLDEPMATALAYMNVSNPVARAGIYDLGGGTFDFSIVDWTRGLQSLRACESDLALGGDDIDQLLAEWVANQVLERWNWDLRNYSEVYARLVAECERAKIRLCFFDETAIELALVDPDGPAASEELRLHKEILDQLSEGLVRRSFVTCDSVLGKAGLRVTDLDAVFLAGGSTHLGRVRDGVEAYFGQVGRFELDPIEVIALGASQLTL